MELLTPELREALPALYAQENVADPIGHIKFFTPDSDWTWYVMEGSEQDGDFVFFGYVCGFENEFGYFRLSELQESRGPLGLAIERDLYFEPTPLSKLRQDRC
jgi:Protein of unknown function (DUF2958)